MKYILSIDQGTTSSRSILINEHGKVASKAQKEFKQIFPKPSWVEHDANEIWETQLQTIKDAIKDFDINKIIGVAITNQRETVVAFDASSGKPIYNAIVWQCRRTAEYCDELKKSHREIIKHKTGLEIDAYFSATKMKWIIENIPEAKELIEKKKLRFGTIDAWLVWNLSGRKNFYTDSTNASRTMLFNIKENKYDSGLLNLFGIEEWMLPEVLSSNGDFGVIDKNLVGKEIPIKAVLGDQQAALFGQCCFNEGDLKVTYGTGGFLLINTGSKLTLSENMLSTIAWSIDNEITYAIEGSTFISGAIIQWLRDGLGIIKDASETEKLAISIDNNEGVYLVPALVGLGAPYWDQNARGIILGLTRKTNKAHIVRAAVESMAYQVCDLISPLKHIIPKSSYVKVDGGATKNNFLLQFQADLLNMPVTRAGDIEATAIGVAYLAGLGSGLWKSREELLKNWHPDELFIPRTNREKEYEKWKDAVKRSMDWSN